MNRTLLRAWLLITGLIVAAPLLLAGCGGTGSTAVPQTTTVPLVATAWPNGTVGQYGLQIDPSLLSNLPETVGGLPLVEAAPLEIDALDDPDLPASFISVASAQAGSIQATDSLSVNIALVREPDQTDQFYQAWRTDFAKGVCSQADGVAKTETQTINDWEVVVATCTGGPRAYTLWIQSGMLVSIQDNGPRHLGTELIDGIN